MCLIVFSYKQLSGSPLVFLANRDEFYERPSLPAGRWDDEPGITAGRDLVSGGTWLGISDSGRLAAVTNYRDPGQQPGRRSRGELVSAFLRSDGPVEKYMERIADIADEFTGFNLIVGEFLPDKTDLFYFSNRGAGITRLSPGLYGLSNHLLDTPWPKVEKAKKGLADLLQSGSLERKALFAILADREPAEDERLPDTGIGYKREKLLSSIFIETPGYGTRSSSLVTVNSEYGFELFEKVFV